MTQRDNSAEDYAELCGLAAKQFKTAIRHSLAQSLVQQYPPPEEIPPELRALLARMEERETQ